MHPAYAAYTLFSSGAFCCLLPAFGLYSRITGKHRQSLSQRMGRYPENLTRFAGTRPRIWFHAASVGEVGAAAAILEALAGHRSDFHFILSTTTEHGRNTAKKKLGNDAVCVFAPVDFIGAVRRSLTAFKPDMLVLLETEIWPNWLVQARRHGVKTAIVNGRISTRSIRAYLRIRGIIKETLRHVDAFSMIHESDADRIRRLGAPGERIFVNGNAKYDMLMRRADPALRQAMARLYCLKPGLPVLVAGSTRHPEESILLDAYLQIRERFPETLLVIAPRHIERAPQIMALLRQYHISGQLRTSLTPDNPRRNAPVVVLDTIGELQAVYGMATVAFCGGSLVPLGGQNVFEAAVWGIPVFYGPSMEDFSDAQKLLESTGGGVQVVSGEDLARKVIEYLSFPRLAKAAGASAKQAVAAHAGAASKHARVIRDLLDA